ncbi:MAG: magnesium transporter CorA family protein [Erysipelotrichaceae bacterium]|nr:magnesium transporter CorA family protein [Erysipelotrichaceae bacterium]
MLEFYKTFDEGTIKLEKPETGCWINAIAPTEEERIYLEQEIGILPEFIKSSLDEEESSHIDYDDDMDQTLVIIDYPTLDRRMGNVHNSYYYTCPMGVILMKGYVVTVALYDSWSVTRIREGRMRDVDTRLRVRFLLTLFLLISQRFLIGLRQIDYETSETEKALEKSLKNEGLLQLLSLEKSLVFFSTSLRSDQATLNRIHRGRHINLFEEDEELLEDVKIEINQCLEMCSIYSHIIAGMREAFSTVINNNMNDVMKYLAIITLVLSIPNIIFGFYGMNVPDLPVPWVWFPSVICIVTCIIALIWLIKGRLFR